MPSVIILLLKFHLIFSFLHYPVIWFLRKIRTSPWSTNCLLNRTITKPVLSTFIFFFWQTTYKFQNMAAGPIKNLDLHCDKYRDQTFPPVLFYFMLVWHRNNIRLGFLQGNYNSKIYFYAPESRCLWICYWLFRLSCKRCPPVNVTAPASSVFTFFFFSSWKKTRVFSECYRAAIKDRDLGISSSYYESEPQKLS